MTDIDDVLRDAMRSSRRPIDARPSLSDVRRRARRRNRRRVGVMAGVVGVAGVATTALVIQRDGSSRGAFLGEGDTEVASTVAAFSNETSTTLGGPIVVTPTMVWDALGAIGIVPADQAAADQMPTPEQIGCTGDVCSPMFAYLVWHEIARMYGVDVQTLVGNNPNIGLSQPPVEGMELRLDGVVPSTTVDVGLDTAPATTVFQGATTTTVAVTFDGVMLIDAGAPQGAMDDAFARLAGYNRTIFPSSGKTSEQTMVMPISGDTAMATAVGTAVGVDGFDTWDPSFAAESTTGIVAVIIGADYWDRVQHAGLVSTTTSIP